MTVTDDLLANATAYAHRFDAHDLPTPPSLRLAIVTCMDARINVFDLFGLADGQAHIIRNAGGVVTADVSRSLALSQRMLGTREIILVQHTRCGLMGISDDGFKAQLEAETGVRPAWATEAFTDLDANVRQSMARLRIDPFVEHTAALRGFVYDVADGRLREVTG